MQFNTDILWPREKGRWTNENTRSDSRLAVRINASVHTGMRLGYIKNTTHADAFEVVELTGSTLMHQ